MQNVDYEAVNHSEFMQDFANLRAKHGIFEFKLEYRPKDDLNDRLGDISKCSNGHFRVSCDSLSLIPSYCYAFNDEYLLFQKQKDLDEQAKNRKNRKK